jgi:hypothetical protein
VDHFSRLSYVYLQHRIGGKETLKAKNAFNLKAYAKDNGIAIKHYHANNGTFAANKWLIYVEAAKQSITFCGVVVHFQNGVAKKRICDLQESTQTMMPQAANKWQTAHSISLWPYALCLANNVHNSTSTKDSEHQSH